MFGGEGGKRFTIKLDVFGFQEIDKARVSQGFFLNSKSGFDSSDPETAKIALSSLSTNESIVAGVKNGLFGDFVEPMTGHAVAFG